MKKFKSAFVIMQVILCIFLVVFAIFAIYEYVFLILAEIMMSLIMFLMAINNKYTIKRDKKFTIIYILLGLILISDAITKVI